MVKEIKYNSLSAVPSDYSSPDGDLSLSVGVVQEDGALKPIQQPSKVLELGTNDVVVYIHETHDFKHYIIRNASWLSWLDENSTEQIPLRSFSKRINYVTGIGNTLLVVTEDGMYYLLWKENSYHYLGQKIPECPLSFGLQGEMKRTGDFTVSFDSIIRDPYAEFTAANKSKVTEQVLAKVNKFIAENSTGKGKFIYPFLLRYAYRLYDGTLTMHSAPILMVASSDIAPQVLYTSLHSGEETATATMHVCGMVHTLDYAVVRQNDISELLKWKDIVTSVDIFISKPIYTYDQNGVCTSFKKPENSNSYCVCKHINKLAPVPEHPLRYQRNMFHNLYVETYNNSVRPDYSTINGAFLNLPTRSSQDVKNDIKNCAQFYFLESIKIEQLTTTRTAVPIEENYLQSLVTREVMTDDYDSHDKIVPRHLFSYNSRINLANVKKELFIGHDAACLFNHTDGYVYRWSNAGPLAADYTHTVSVYVYIKQDNRNIVVKCNGAPFGYNTPILFFYYPNPNAYKAVVSFLHYPPADYYEIPLEKHAFLNGAFYFNGWEDLTVTTNEFQQEQNIVGRTINLKNKIYTSEINNPFLFPVTGINTVGTGEIIGISTAAKALSQGQFGQFPLYAFTTDGIWALEVSATGTYSAKQPITRDVIIKNTDGSYNADSITQIDSAVLFATDRGIMLISGSQTQCITDTINNIGPLDATALPKMERILSIYNTMAAAHEQLTSQDITVRPFLEFLKNCKILYDYTHQRIIVYNPGVRYAYVYSLKTNTWGMTHSRLTSNVNSYPEALAMSTDNDGDPVLVDFTKEQENDDNSVTAFIVTRPFKMDDPNIHKTIDTLIQRGMFPKDNIRQVLYGTNDFYHWHPVWSSSDKYMRGFRGTPYKAFRLAIIAHLNKEESLYGCSVQFTPKLTNQPR